jgi:hypothetical protein
MDNDLNKYFVTLNVYKGPEHVYTLTIPRSLLHSIRKCKYPGSEFNISVIDHTGNFRITTEAF